MTIEILEPNTLETHINEKYLTFCLEEFIQREKFFDEKLEFIIKNAKNIETYIRRSFVNKVEEGKKAIIQWQFLVKLISDHKIFTADYLIESSINHTRNKSYVHPDNLIQTLKTFSSKEHIELLRTKIKLLAELSARYENLMLPFLNNLPSIPKNSLLYEEINTFFNENYPAEPDKNLKKREFSLKEVLGDLFISPVQKLAKYKTQITDLSKNVLEKSPLYSDVQLLLKTAEEEAIEANELLKRTGYKRRSTQNIEKNPGLYLYIQNVIRFTDFCFLTPLGKKMHQEARLKKSVAIEFEDVKVLEAIKIAALRAYFEMQSEEKSDHEILGILKGKIAHFTKNLNNSKNRLIQELVQTLESLSDDKQEELDHQFLKVPIIKLEVTKAKNVAKSFKSQNENSEKYIHLSFLHSLKLLLNQHIQKQAHSFFKPSYDVSHIIINRLKERIDALYRAIEEENVGIKNILLGDDQVLTWFNTAFNKEISDFYGSLKEITSLAFKKTYSKVTEYVAHISASKGLCIQEKAYEERTEQANLHLFKGLNFQLKENKSENSPLKDRRFFVFTQRKVLRSVKDIFSEYKKELENRTGIYGFFKNTNIFKIQAFEKIFTKIIDLMNHPEPLAENLPDLIETIRQVFIENTKKCGEIEKIYRKGDFGKAFIESLNYLNELSLPVKQKIPTENVDNSMDRHRNILV